MLKLMKMLHTLAIGRQQTQPYRMKGVTRHPKRLKSGDLEYFSSAFKKVPNVHPLDRSDRSDRSDQIDQTTSDRSDQIDQTRSD